MRFLEHRGNDPSHVMSHDRSSTIRYWRQDPDYDLADGFGKAARYAAESLTPRE